MANVRLRLDRRTTGTGGVHPVNLGVSFNGRYMYVSVRMRVRDTQFDETGGADGATWIVRHLASAVYNTKLRTLVLAVESELLSMLSFRNEKAVRERVRACVRRVMDKDNGDEEDKSSLLYVFRTFADMKRTRTREIYEATIKKVQAYDPYDTSVADVGLDWIVGFERFMRDNGLGTNSIAIHLRNLRAVLNYAIGEGLTKAYPFRRFVIKKEETPKRSLNISQLAEFRDWPCESHQERYRDIFMLSFYLLGINMVDLCSAMKSDVVNGRLEYRRAKTHKLYSVKILPEAMAIIKKYAGARYLLYIMEEYGDYRDFVHRMNGNLQSIGHVEVAKRYNAKHREPLYPNITTYWARHTWATIAHRLGVSKDVISMALGHSFGVKVTDVYIDYDMEKVDEANRLVVDNLNAAGGLPGLLFAK